MALGYDESKLGAFMERAIADMGAAMHATLVLVGDKLGLYKAMAGAGSITPADLAQKKRHCGALCSRVAGRQRGQRIPCLRCRHQSIPVAARAGFRTYAIGPAEGFRIISSCFKDAPKVAPALRTGEGVGWRCAVLPTRLPKRSLEFVGPRARG